MSVAILAYVALSLTIAGVVVTYEIWHRPVMLDRADGRGKFPSPKMGLGEIFFFGLFVALLWPILAMAAIIDGRGTKGG